MDFSQITDAIGSIVKFLEESGAIDAIKEYAPVVLDAIKEYVPKILEKIVELVFSVV